ncbi:MAG TPA: GtrA family protein [Legionella sp.]|nr:GtrA family protein [Legionella sp.]
MKPLFKYPDLREIMRYGIVGVINNLIGYVVYLIVTFFWLDPKIAITIFYSIGAIIAYFGHAKYSFSQRTMSFDTAVKFSIAYLIGYAINYLMLFILSDKLLYPHQLVQGLAIFVVAGILFCLLRFFVFPLKTEI